MASTAAGGTPRWLDQVRDASDQHRRLSATRTGQHAERAFLSLDDLALARGEVACVQRRRVSGGSSSGPRPLLVSSVQRKRKPVSIRSCNSSRDDCRRCKAGYQCELFGAIGMPSEERLVVVRTSLKTASTAQTATCGRMSFGDTRAQPWRTHGAR